MTFQPSGGNTNLSVPEYESEVIYLSVFLFSTEAVRLDSLMGDRAARVGGCGFPVPRARPWGR